MKKQLLFIGVLISLTLLSCGTNKQETYDVTSLLSVVEQKVDKEVTISGIVTHVCRHSGKRCFIVANGSDETIRIEAGGEIASFDQELVGTEITAKGIVREQRIEEEKIEEKEKNLEVKKAEAEDETAKGHCANEQNSIDKMRQWMQDNGKDYYAIYYIEGLSLVE